MLISVDFLEIHAWIYYGFSDQGSLQQALSESSASLHNLLSWDDLG